MPDIDNLWDEALPSDGSLAVRGQREIVNTWQAVQFGLTPTLEWPGGELKEGVSRAFVGAASTGSFPSVASTAFKLHYISDEDRLLYYMSGFDLVISDSTLLLGSPYRATHAGTAQNPDESRSYWASVSGQTLVDKALVLPGKNFALKYTFNGLVKSGVGSDPDTQRPFWAAKPTVIVTSSTSNSRFGVSSATTGGFLVSHISLLGRHSDATLYWIATGPISLTHVGSANNAKLY